MSKFKDIDLKKRTVFFKLIKLSGLFFTIPVFIALLIFITGFLPLQHPKLKSYIYSQLELSGLNIESIGNIRVILWKGISLNGLVISSKIGSNSNCECAFESIFINCNVIKVFFKWRKWKSKHLPIPDNYYHENLINRNIKNIISGFNEIFDYSTSMEISGTDILFVKNDSSLFMVNNISAQIDHEKSNPDGFKSSYSIDSINLPHFNKELTSIHGSLLYDEENIIISDCNANFKQGSVNITGAVDVGKTRIKRLNVKGSNIDISNFYEENAINGSLDGFADFAITFCSSPFIIDSLDINGSIKTSLLMISNLPVQRAFMKILSTDKIKKLCFENTETTLKKTPGNSKYEITLTGNGDQINFVSKGWFSKDGYLNQQVEGIINENFAKELPRMITGSLEKKDSGRYFKCKLYGAFCNPKIELDRNILKKAVKNMFINIKTNFKNKFQE